MPCSCGAVRMNPNQSFFRLEWPKTESRKFILKHGLLLTSDSRQLKHSLVSHKSIFTFCSEIVNDKIHFPNLHNSQILLKLNILVEMRIKNFIHSYQSQLKFLHVHYHNTTPLNFFSGGLLIYLGQKTTCINQNIRVIQYMTKIVVIFIEKYLHDYINSHIFVSKD